MLFDPFIPYPSILSLVSLFLHHLSFPTGFLLLASTSPSSSDFPCHCFMESFSDISWLFSSSSIYPSIAPLSTVLCSFLPLLPLFPSVPLLPDVVPLIYRHHSSAPSLCSLHPLKAQIDLIVNCAETNRS